MLFLGKLKEEERDNVLYVEEELFKFDCGHYFASLNVEGSCYSRSMTEEDIKDMKYTILTTEELVRLLKVGQEISELGYGIDKDDERYQKGLEIKESINDIMGKLNSKENEEYYNNTVLPEEVERLKAYDLTDEDIKEIFENYPLGEYYYKDSSIVGYVFNDIDEFTDEEAWQFGYVKNDRPTENCPDKYVLNYNEFDYEQFGDELLESERYLELDNGKIISYMY